VPHPAVVVRNNKVSTKKNYLSEHKLSPNNPSLTKEQILLQEFFCVFYPQFQNPSPT
jgi:hypothetical protein